MEESRVVNITSSRGWSTMRALAFYFICGWIHELSHLIAATAVQRKPPFELNSLPLVALGALFGRSCSIPGYDPNSDAGHLILHVGWIISVVAAAYCIYRRDRCPRELTLASIATAIDALCTDLLKIGTVRGVASTTLFCGNFGIILLNTASWTSDEGKTALNLLQEMIRITMMRGAQSGGVVAWANAGSPYERRGIRSRVVNGKRSDLSVRLRNQVQGDVWRTFSRTLKPGIRTFLGHTRFATSSKATYQGTHPHRWTPPRRIRIFDIYSSDHQPRPRARRVETFVTHNGDLDFYKVGSAHAVLEEIQEWLSYATGAPMPCTVDSAAIAGLIDLLRCSGSLGLSLRYALLLDSPHSAIKFEPTFPVPTWGEFEKVGRALEDVLVEFCSQRNTSLAGIRTEHSLRRELVDEMTGHVETAFMGTLLEEHIRGRHIEEASGTTPFQLMQKTVQGFFDQDLFEATRIFLRKASGTFGLMVTCSLDARQQICIAANGQPMSVGFFPRKGLISFGSEQAAVKAGLSFSSPFGDKTIRSGANMLDNHSFRLDLNDLSGEVCLLDWGEERRRVTLDRRCKEYQIMDGGVTVTLYQPNRVSDDPSLLHRLVPLEDDNLILPYPVGAKKDPVLADLKDIPRVCRAVQASWRKPGLNRLTAWNLSRRLRKRLRDRVDGKIPARGATVDILLTGCEVSLWVAEQFASDLQKAFPGLFVKSLSANKILGVFGPQELPTPAIGHAVSKEIPDLHDTIVIIVSNSGQNFAPLACSNLLQSVTKNIFVVTSEWDTQIGKQLRALFGDDDELFSSRIFSTNVGIRPAEPCSLTVAATHQLLTNLFSHICIVMSEPYFRDLSGAAITEDDLRILEKCNQENISALEQIVGASRIGSSLVSETEWALRDTGRRWSRHVLENAKAYTMCISYIVVTVTTGYPIISGIAIAAGIEESGWGYYIGRFFDSLIYLFLPQICVTLLRIVEGRNLIHRMVTRTVIIGDIPWVSQSMEQFVSKLFARSYSIAGLNVLSGNPADHLLHRHTHRIVRGSLLVCGRPDGRLSALTSAEMAVVLALSQATSIQSLGSTCETITIGHNASAIPLATRDIFLADCRPKFLCEQLLAESNPEPPPLRRFSSFAVKTIARRQKARGRLATVRGAGDSTESSTLDRSDRKFGDSKESGPSSHAIKGRYMTMKKDARSSSRRSLVRSFSITQADRERLERANVHSIVADLTKSYEESAYLRILFDDVDADNDGRISAEEFVSLYNDVKRSRKKENVLKIFEEIEDGSGAIGFEEFLRVARMAEVEVERTLITFDRDQRGLIQVTPSDETYFGESLRQVAPSLKDAYTLSKTQHLAMELYESRIASFQRFVSLCVLFHEVGSRVEGFFRTISFGLLGYQMDQTHSILRITTTASPVGASDVRERMERLRLTNKVRNAVRTISTAWLRYDKKTTDELKRSHHDRARGISFDLVHKLGPQDDDTLSEGHVPGTEDKRPTDRLQLPLASQTNGTSWREGSYQ